jgi:hypothetical protein
MEPGFCNHIIRTTSQPIIQVTVTYLTKGFNEKWSDLLKIRALKYSDAIVRCRLFIE